LKIPFYIKLLEKILLIFGFLITFPFFISRDFDFTFFAIPLLIIYAIVCFVFYWLPYAVLRKIVELKFYLKWVRLPLVISYSAIIFSGSWFYLR
jgi:hypothetical protein